MQHAQYLSGSFNKKYILHLKHDWILSISNDSWDFAISNFKWSWKKYRYCYLYFSVHSYSCSIDGALVAFETSLSSSPHWGRCCVVLEDQYGSRRHESLQQKYIKFSNVSAISGLEFSREVTVSEFSHLPNIQSDYRCLHVYLTAAMLVS